MAGPGQAIGLGHTYWYGLFERTGRRPMLPVGMFKLDPCPLVPRAAV
jgi:hypothetical protein